MLHHVSGEHEWATGRCDHDKLTEPPTNQDGKTIQYFRKEDAAFQSLQKIVLDQRWLQTLKYYTMSRYYTHGYFIYQIHTVFHTQAYRIARVISQSHPCIHSKANGPWVSLQSYSA